jgi:hypothetical protein
MAKQSEPAKRAKWSRPGAKASAPPPEGPITIKLTEENRAIGVMPESFPPDYVAGSVVPFFFSTASAGETPTLPMIDLMLSKEMAIDVQWLGVIYDGWVPNPEGEGVSVFLKGYENRGANNERKKIYMTAVTPDLIDSKYRDKIVQFFGRLLADENAGRPLLKKYFESYDDFYWDLHLGASRNEIPIEARQFSEGFRTLLGYYYPTLEIHRDAVMLCRKTRPALREWLDERIQRIIDGKQPNADQTFVHYWVKNGGLGDVFPRQDILFECFHNFLALSQWGNMVYHVAAVLEPTRGDAKVREWFEKTMNEPEQTDGAAFTRLDRFAMELFRTINPNSGSFSTVTRLRDARGSEFPAVITEHLPASMAERHWENPSAFDPDRYKSAQTTTDHDDAHCREIGLARCPFSKDSFKVKDGRGVAMTNTAFGAIHAEVDGQPHPLVDTAGYAPFGFGYRRCAGEYITIEFVKEYLRAIWNRKISFQKLDNDQPERVPVNPHTVLNDDITFQKAR